MDLHQISGDRWHLKVLWKWNERLMELEKEDLSWRVRKQRNTKDIMHCMASTEAKLEAKTLQDAREALEENKSLSEVRVALEERQQELDSRTGPVPQVALDRQQGKLDDMWRLLEEQTRILEKEKEVNFDMSSDQDGVVQVEKFFFRRKLLLTLRAEMQDVEDADVKLEMEEFFADSHEMFLHELFEKLRWPNGIFLQAEDGSGRSSEKKLPRSSLKRDVEEKLQDLISQHSIFAKNKKWWVLHKQQLKIMDSSSNLEKRQRELDQQQMSDEEKSSEQKYIDEEWMDIHSQKEELDTRRWNLDKNLKKQHVCGLNLRLNRWLESSSLKNLSGSAESPSYSSGWYLNILLKLNQSLEEMQEGNPQPISINFASVKATETLDEARRALEERLQQVDSLPGPLSHDSLDRQQGKLDDLCRLLDEQQWLHDIGRESAAAIREVEGELRILPFFFRRKLSLMLLREIQKLPEFPNVRKRLEENMREQVKLQCEQLMRELRRLCGQGGSIAGIPECGFPYSNSGVTFLVGDSLACVPYHHHQQQPQHRHLQQQEQRLLRYLNNFCEDLSFETQNAQDDIPGLCQRLISCYPNFAKNGGWWDLHEQQLKIVESTSDLETRQTKLDRRSKEKSSEQKGIDEGWKDIRKWKKELDAARWDLDGRLRKLHLQRIVKRRKWRIERLQQIRNLSVEQTPRETCSNVRANNAQ